MSAHAHNSSHAGSSPHDHGALQMGHHHVSSSAMFFNVLVALLFLTGITVATSRFDFGGANMLIAMAIASVKAALVMGFFMHLKWDTAINKLVFFGSFLFLSLLFIFTLADQATRRMDSDWHVRKPPVDKQWVYKQHEAPAGKH
jgi:cytochrome c oxidase subunit 4